MSDDESRKKSPASVRDPLPDDAQDEDGRIEERAARPAPGRPPSGTSRAAPPPDDDDDDDDLDPLDDDDDDDDDEESEASRGRESRRRGRKRRSEGESGEEEREGFWERNIGRRLEGLMPDAMKRAVVGSLGSIFMSEDGLKQQLTELRLPKEIVSFILQQSNNTKREFMRIVAREIREFLEHTDFYDELRKILTSLSFEIRTEVRLIPNDQAFVKPEIKNRVRVKRHGKDSEPEGDDAAGADDEARAEDDDDKPRWTERLIGGRGEKRREKRADDE